MLQSSDLLRGLTDSLILAQLEVKDNYGYELNKSLSKLSDGEFELKEATLYTTFRRLEENKYIVSYWGDENSGARRRYYSITDEGKRILSENKKDWTNISSKVSKVLYL